MSRRFDIDVAAVSVRHFPDLFHNIDLSRIHYHMGAEFLCQRQTVRPHVEGDEILRVLHGDISYHSKPQRTGARKDDEILVGDIRSVHTVF
jgi:hypothetical protein